MIGHDLTLQGLHARQRTLPWAVLAGILFLAASIADAGASTCAAPGANLDAQKREWLGYGCSSDYARDLAAALADASAYVESRAGEVARPAMVLDIDETSLSNFPQLLANDFEHIPRGPCRMRQGGTCGDLTWELTMRAGAIAPTLALFNAAKARGVAVFFITGRNDEPALRRATAGNLRRAGYNGWTALIMRAPNEREGVSALTFKTNRRRLIESEGYTIIATVGDQWSDVDGGYAERKYKLPNPFYFIP